MCEDQCCKAISVLTILTQIYKPNWSLWYNSRIWFSDLRKVTCYLEPKAEGDTDRRNNQTVFVSTAFTEKKLSISPEENKETQEFI